jgi:hypothetical protein
VAKKSAGRKLVTPDHMKDALAFFHSELKRRINQKGSYSHVNSHETLGLITEEMHELIVEIHADHQNEKLAHELTDVAVGCIFGVASYLARTNSQKLNPPPPKKKKKVISS